MKEDENHVELRSLDGASSWVSRSKASDHSNLILSVNAHSRDPVTV